MNTSFLKKLSNIIILSFFIFYAFWIGNIYANNNKNVYKYTDFSEKYYWKKLRKIKNTIKWKKDYKILINTTDSLEEIKNYFSFWNTKVKIKKIGK